MEKIDNEIIEQVATILNVAKDLKINAIAIGNGKIGAIDEAQQVVMYDDNEKYTYPFGVIGLNRPHLFVSRYNLMCDKPDLEFFVDVDSKIIRGEEVSIVKMIKMQTSAMSVEFRAANPAVLRIPKKLNTETIFTSTFDSEIIKVIGESNRVMESEIITFIHEEEKYLRCEIYDDINDKLEIDLSKYITVNETEGDFEYKYPVNQVLVLLKKSEDKVVSVTCDGLLKFDLNGVNVYVVPRV